MYNDVYLKVGHQPAMWLVQKGIRRLVKDQDELMKLGMKKVIRVTQEKLDAIPIEGQKRGSRDTRSNADEGDDAAGVPVEGGDAVSIADLEK